MKIAIVGFGAAAIGFIERMKKTKYEIHIFEKSPDIYSSSVSGIRADGKLFVSNEMGGDIEISLELQKDLVDYYVYHTASKTFESGKSFRNKESYIKFYQKGFQPIGADFYHLGTDQLKEVLYNIYENFKKYKNIHFHYNENIESIEINEDQVVLSNSQKFDKVFVAAGRSGHKLIKSIIAQYPEFILDNSMLDLGIRYEMPDHIVEELNHEMYEFKLKYKSRTGYMVRTFCNNPSGYVVTENYDDFCTVNGHANMSEKSNNTNFAVLSTIKLTQPFNDPISYGSYIARLTNLLAGENKVILQTYDQFKSSKRTKALNRVMPTLDSDKFILGDINLAFPRRIIESIIDFIDKLNEIVPGVGNSDNLVYAPEIKFYSNKLDNRRHPNVKFIGDCSGATRSIIYATAHGWLEAEELLKEK